MTPQNDLLIEIKNLKTYFALDEGTVKAVDGATLDVRRGETLGVVGESGCGKSMIARSILRIIDPPGQIVDGEILYYRSQAGAPPGASHQVDVIDLAKVDPRGPQIRLSRGHRNMLRRLLEREIPEIFNGIVEIKSIAREPGQRSKVAVAATQAGVDPVGSCVGMRGTRIQNIVDELGGEKIDIVEWSAEVQEFISNALSPAKPTDSLLIEEGDVHTAVVIVPDRQLSLAIGKEGQNARLAAKLTGWRIDIKSETEAETEGLNEIKRQQMQLIKARNLETKATTPPPDDLLSRAEWLLRQKDKQAMTLEQVAKMLADSEATAREAEMLEPLEEQPAQAAQAEALAATAEAEQATPEAAVVSPATEAPAAEPAAESARAEPAQAVPEGLEPEIVEPPYENYPLEEGAEVEAEGEEGDKAKKVKSKKTAKKRELVFDEELGRVVSVLKRKRGKGWGDEEY